MEIKMENKRAPRVRFKGFTEDWEQRKLGNQMYIKSRIGWQALTRDEYLETGDYYLITGTDIDESSHTVDLKHSYYVSKERYEMDNKIQVKEGDIIVTKDGTIGKVAMVTGLDKPATLNSHLFVLRDLSGNLDNRYLLQILNSHIFDAFVNSTKTGSTLTGLPQKTFVEFRFPVPCFEEQKKISSFLDNLDNLITLHQRKLVKLNSVKKSMMGKMFPKNGKRVPEIRFAGFTDDWEQRKLGEVAQITMGQSPDGSTYSDTPSDYILVQGNADLKDGWVSPRIWTTQETKTAATGDLIMSVRAPAGAMGKTAYDVVLGRGVAGIKGNEFIYQTLVKMDSNGYWKRLAAGSTFESVNSDAVNNAEIMIPQDMAEQDRIGDYFKQLDSLITLHQSKLTKLMKIKQSMLESMFV